MPRSWANCSCSDISRPRSQVIDCNSDFGRPRRFWTSAARTSGTLMPSSLTRRTVLVVRCHGAGASPHDGVPFPTPYLDPGLDLLWSIMDRDHVPQPASAVPGTTRFPRGSHAAPRTQMCLQRRGERQAGADVEGPVDGLVRNPYSLCCGGGQSEPCRDLLCDQSSISFSRTVLRSSSCTSSLQGP